MSAWTVSLLTSNANLECEAFQVCLCRSVVVKYADYHAYVDEMIAR